MTQGTDEVIASAQDAEGLRARFGDRSANPSRVRLDAFARRAAESLPAGARVLDAGSGEGTYRRHFAHTAYESADFKRIDKTYGAVDHVCSLDDIPVPDERFDLVLCTQVLEHLPEPGAVLDELYRVLRAGGRLWLSAPLFYPEHEQPYDFYRYTSFGLRHRLSKAGFEIESLDWLEGYLGTLSFQLTTAGHALPRRAASYGGGLVGLACAAVATLGRPVFGALGRTLARLELRHRHTASGHPKNYAVVARRTGSPTR